MPLNRFIKVEKIDGKLKVIVIFYIWCAFVSDGLGCYNDVLAAWLRQPWAGAGLDRDRMTGTWARRRIALSIKVKRGKAVAKGQGGLGLDKSASQQEDSQSTCNKLHAEIRWPSKS